MPFIGRDWRSPGEAWVKTESLGWQRMKIIESQLHLPCHQSHASACSWPPRSHFGQHMEANCGQAADEESHNLAAGAVSSNHRRHHHEVCSQGGSSQCSSSSTSPTGSPEKNGARHIHPITISSPYGRFSSPCCARHYHDSDSPSSPGGRKSPGSPNNCNSYLACHHHQHHPHDLTDTNAQANTKSLSRDDVSASSTDCACSPRLLRYNNSVSDFRNTAAAAAAAANYIDEPSNCAANNDDRRPSPSDNASRARGGIESSHPNMVVLGRATSNLPILMRDGGAPASNDAASKPPSGAASTLPAAQPAISPASSRSNSPSPPGSPVKQLAAEPGASEPAQRPCACCCCSTAASNGVNSLHHHHHHLMLETNQPKTAPHCRISVRTREVAMHNTISEAFYRLDFYNAIHDIRRFNYICKLLHLLITQNLTSLSGCATRVLFTMLEQVAWEVSSNKRNVHVIRNLLNELKQTIQKYYCWGRPIGSSLLWQQHFETIERISQIVNGIDFAPPKSDSYNNVTFDKLPVEMVREILLRLDDYRDLVSSAQASPVMQTMIDGQSIWQKLCQYHFTEQQLKLALESGGSGGGGGGSTLAKRNTLRGVKYARTTTADGRGSYRNPVAHKQPPSSAAAAGAAALRRQAEPTSGGRRGSNGDGRRHSAAAGGGSDAGSPPPTTSGAASSYVTNAVRIFDDKQRGSARGAGSKFADGSRRSSLKAASTDQRLAAVSKRNERPAMRLEGTGNEVDWERVFHQLRKRFDLKEEYADCLLLCRHCRCLFWKSFGHPCIKGDDMRQHPAASIRPPSKPTGAGEAGDTGGHSGAAAAAAGHARQDQSRAARASAAAALNGGRPSVASLSRSFDRASRNESAATAAVAAAAAANENARPSGGGPGGRGVQGGARQGAGLAGGGRAAGARQPLNNLNAQLREHNANRQQRQQYLPPAGRDNAASGAARREELVPKHVTITPQAFLKFFSL